MGSGVVGAGVNPADQRWGFSPLLPLGFQLQKQVECPICPVSPSRKVLWLPDGLALRDRQTPCPCLAGQANRNQHRMVWALKAMSVKADCLVRAR